MGPLSYNESVEEWADSGLFPSTLTKDDRVGRWWCSLHSKDETGKRVIEDPEVKKIADAVVSSSYIFPNFYLE